MFNLSGRFIRTRILFALLCTSSCATGFAIELGAIEVGPVPEEVRATFQLDPFYQKFTDVGGLPVVGSVAVADEAIAEAAWLVKKMLGDRADILKAMAQNKTRLAVMAHNEYTTDVPEHRHLRPAEHWDRRARGLGATRWAPAVSCAEENLLSFPGDPYRTENICIHEFAHAIHAMGMSTVDPTFDQRLKATYESALERGLWKGTYAASNRDEYWAEGVQSWFDNNRENDGAHNHVNTRAELREYDEKLAALCEEVLGDKSWRYVKPLKREASERAHLTGFDFSNTPRFRWRGESRSKETN
jgi:hypothetical protein